MSYLYHSFILFLTVVLTESLRNFKHTATVILHTRIASCITPAQARDATRHEVPVLVAIDVP